MDRRKMGSEKPKSKPSGEMSKLVIVRIPYEEEELSEAIS